MMGKNSMIQCMRWYGPNDVVSLRDIAQAGCSGVVSALHQYTPGEIWPYEDIVKHKQEILNHGMSWEVVESLPVHDHIKLGYEDRNALIENYKQSLRNLAKANVKIVTYNFMPLLDWLRTNVSHKTEVGSEVLYYNKKDYSVFDLFILERDGASLAYTSSELDDLKVYYNSLSEEYLTTLKNSLLMALPGTDENFTIDLLRNKLKEYSFITSDRMRENLIFFLNDICPLADDLGIKMTIHPDDPPFSVFGLPRIFSTFADCKYIFENVQNESNGICFCTGSLGARQDNHLVEMLRELGSRVHFLHLRNTKRLGNGDFYEADHLSGDADMYAIIKEVVDLMSREGRSIPMRPDHGAKMMDDIGKKSYPGYSAIGRLKGLAELRGVEYAIQQSMINRQ